MLTVYEICFVKFKLEDVFIKTNLMPSTLCLGKGTLFSKNLKKDDNIIENISQEILMLLNALQLGKGPLYCVFLHSSPHQKRKKLLFSF